MNQRLRARATGFIFVSAAACALAVAAGCSDDASSLDQPGADPSAPQTGTDSGTRFDSSVETPADAGTDSATATDAADASMPLQGCAARPNAAFCDDFDSPDALKPGTTKWDFIESTDQPVATLSTVQRVSAPSSLLSRIIDGTTPGAKFAKTVTKANFTESTWEYDVFLENIGTSDGFFLDDFQFSDAAGTDSFGFRLVMFANAGALGELKVEHNQQANGGPYVIEQPLASGQVALGQWHHFKQTVKFAFASGDGGADAGDGGTGNTAEYSLSIDDAPVAAFQKKYPGITRQQATIARIAAMPLVFNKANSAGLKIYWDNQALELK